MKEQSSGNSLRLEGFLDIELVNKKNHFRKTMHNTITKGGKQLFLDKSAGQILNISLEPTGIMASLTDLTLCYQYNGRYAHYNQCLTNALLNLTDEQLESLSVETTHIHCWNASLKSPERIIGYANNNLVPTNDGREGRIDYCKGEYIADDMCVAKRWVYPEGIATGTINAIAMMPATAVKTANGAGFSTWKCLDKVNSLYTNFGGYSTSFCPPGVPGLTDNNHILLNFTQDSKSRWSYNLQTGEITEVGADDPFWVIPTSYVSDLTDVHVEDGYLYLISNGQVYVFRLTDTENHIEYVTYFGIGTGTRSMSYPIMKFLKFNGDLYVTFFQPYDSLSTAYTYYTARKLVKGAAYYSSQGDYYTDYSFMEFTPPTGLVTGRYCLSNYGGAYVLYAASEYWDGTPGSIRYGDMYCYTGYVFTSLSDIWGTFMQKICAIPRRACISFNAGSNAGLLKLGNNYGDSGYQTTANLGYTDNRDHYAYSVNNSGEKQRAGLGSAGIYLATDGSWSDVLSFVKLTEPVVKSDDDILFVSYGYRIV